MPGNLSALRSGIGKTIKVAETTEVAVKVAEAEVAEVETGLPPHEVPRPLNRRRHRDQGRDLVENAETSIEVLFERAEVLVVSIEVVETTKTVMVFAARRRGARKAGGPPDLPKPCPSDASSTRG